MIKLAEAVLVCAALSAGSLAAQERWVGEVRFKGNRSLDELTLAAGIWTSSSGQIFQFFRIGDRNRWDELEFRRDVVRLQLLYRQHGYYEARVDTTVDRSDNLIDVMFRITEGPPILVDSVAVTGVDSVPSGDRFDDWIPLRRGRPFDRFLFEASADSITVAIRNHGYPWATVFRNYAVNLPTRTARAEYEVVTGPRSRIGAIQIEGQRRVKERTILRSLALHEGDPFRLDALYESQRSLYQSELFRYASVGIAPDSVVGGQDSLVRVRVQVAEATPTQIRAGLGYGTIDCFRTSATFTRLNFIGEARRLDVVGRLSRIGVGSPLHFGFENSVCPELANDPFSVKLNYLGSVTLTQPTTLLKRSTISLSGFAERRSEFNAYLFESFGGSLGLKFGLGRHVPLSLTYRLSQDQTTAAPATYCVYFDQCDPGTLAPFSAPQRQGTLTFSIVNTRTDSPIEPSNGYVLSFEATTASPVLGSQIVFDRVVVEAVGYRRWHRKVFSARVRGGIIRQGVSQIGDSAFRYVPPSDRFYAGGPTTVRGFARNEMGPLVYIADSVMVAGGDTTYLGLRSSPIGSGAIILANVEMRIPTPFFAGRIALTTFVDAGELWNSDGYTLIPGGIKITPGAGIQVSTPLGPMRLEAAYNNYRTQPGRLYRINGGNLELVTDAFPGRTSGRTFLSKLQWHFSVGLAF